MKHSNESYNLSRWQFESASAAWSSNESDTGSAFVFHSNGFSGSMAKGGANGSAAVLPIIEIPITK